MCKAGPRTWRDAPQGTTLLTPGRGDVHFNIRLWVRYKGGREACY